MESIDQFIGIYENAFSKEFCERVIEQFNKMDDCGYTLTRQESASPSPKHIKDDTALFLQDEKEINLNHLGNISREFNATLKDIFHKGYTEKFSILKDHAALGSYTIKVQKTVIGGGYHIWHCENSVRPVSNRILAWMLYLNTVDEGGETEFLYQHARVKPQQGTLLIWPAAFTHTHRGNPPLSNEKYIITGWFEF